MSGDGGFLGRGGGECVSVEMLGERLDGRWVLAEGAMYIASN